MKSLTVKINPFVASAVIVVLFMSIIAKADSYSDIARQSYEQQEQMRVQKIQAEEKAKINQNNSRVLRKLKELGQRLHQPISNLVCYDNTYARGGGDDTPWCNSRGSCVSVISEAAYNPYPLSPLSWPSMVARATAPKRAKEIRVCHFEISGGVACEYQRSYDEDGNRMGTFNCLNRAGKTVVNQSSPDNDSDGTKPVVPRNEETSTPPAAE